MTSARILIGADLVPTKSNFDLFKKGDSEALLGKKLKEILESAEYRIFNLEVPFADIEAPIEKVGPALCAPTDTVKGYKAMGVDVLTLANNHIRDQGVQGIESTCKVLSENKINYLGVGKDSLNAAKPHVFDFAGKKVGIYACAEHEYSIVTECAAGANPFDPLESLNQIVSLKNQCDYVIVLYHGGKEYYRYPSPDLQRVCRKMVSKGADLVICQHSHCVGCEEHYEQGTIIYGQGNFLFDNSGKEAWKTGILIQIDDAFKITYIPLCKYDNGVRLAEGECAESIMKGFEVRSREILQPGFIMQKYTLFAENELEGYLERILCLRNSLIYRGANKLSGNRLRKWIINKRYRKKNYLALRNYIECEAHRELILRALTDKSNTDGER